MRHLYRRAAFTFVLCACLANRTADAATFGFFGHGEIADLSPDGSIIVGGNADVSPSNGVWKNGIFQPLPVPAPYTESAGAGVSANNNFVVGSAIKYFSGGSDREAVRWTNLGSPQLLGDLPGGQFQSKAENCSADGSVAVGSGYDVVGQQPVRWTASGIEKLSGGSASFAIGEAMDVSGDGSTIVGWGSASATSFIQRPFRWTQSTGFQLFGGVDFRGQAAATNADGSVIVGTANGLAFRWTESLGVQMLGTLDSDTPGSTALATSEDGSVIVGQSQRPGFNDGFIWDAEHGMRSLTTLIPELGFSLQGNYIEQANAISADGTVIVGRAFGNTGSVWKLTVPEPHALALLPFAAMALRRKVRSSSRSAAGHGDGSRCDSTAHP